MNWQRINLLITMQCFIVSIVLAQDNLPLWFKEQDFDKNVNRWYKVNEYNEKTYHNALYVNAEKDFRLVAEFDSDSLDIAAKWGMSWARKDAYKYYHFEINSDQEFRIGYQLNGKFNVIESWVKKSKIIDKGYNQLEVQKKGTVLQFFINGKMVYKMPYRAFDHTGVAMKSSAASVVFKSFSIYQDMGAIKLVDGGDVAAGTMPRNLGKQVNSEYVDKSPTISPDGKTLYFVREEARDGFGGQDIYYSTRSEDGVWSLAQNIGRPLNNNSNNFVNAVMPDNNTLMAINSYGRTSMDEVLAFTHRTKDGWSQPQRKAIRRLQHVGRWVSFDLAADGRTIVFSMKRPDTYGGRDLYVSFLQADGNFSAPRNLGPTINTEGNEHCPFLAADGKTLYFDTDGHPGYGGRDIFMAKRLDHTWTNWEVPKNLGPTINTKGADEGLVIPASGEYAYFVSDKDSYGGYDIYSLKMPKALRPDPTALITGYVINCFDQKAIPTSIYVYKDGALSEDAYARTNPINGEFKLALAGGAKYKVVAVYNKEIETSSHDTIEIDLTGLSQYEERELDPICFQPKKKPHEAVKIPIRASHTPSFRSVYFDHDEYKLTNKAIAILDKMADTLKIYPQIDIEVLGHTDSNGSHDYNWTLAMNRSGAVIRYLEQKGIDRVRFAFKGFGETKPIENNATHQGRAINRRVEFQVVKPKVRTVVSQKTSY
ncbi:OmpA family protein [Aureispira anguillae]|uniref:OmpA family protein n=1 Tax=Aureispira anguillae TaxID=2864201 RepID=A0A915YJH5_9BACT|nr:OmpA family protein [Aureispira anguillae]BDS14342.1 OmpA family protein [Aureispira anguillae]